MKKKKTLRLLLVFLLSVTYLMVNTVSVHGLLLKGSKGNDVVKLQNDLKSLGYFNANSTGYYGSLTEDAVKSFQRDNNLAADGIAGPSTMERLEKVIRPSINSSQVLKKGMRSSSVTELQNNLKKLGYFNANATGFYGSITETAVRKLQSAHGLYVDGIAGSATLSKINALLSGNVSPVSANVTSRSEDTRQENYLVKWFGGAEKIFSRGTVATVYDVETGLKFKVKRTFGTNHADVEPLTAEDTATMKKIYGGSWSWARRAIVVDVDGRNLAASMNGMPHAGLEKYPSLQYVSGRSGGYGSGTNYDEVKGNNFNGHFCIHFYKSRTHGSNKEDANHQAMVKKANEWLIRNN